MRLRLKSMELVWVKRFIRRYRHCWVVIRSLISKNIRMASTTTSFYLNHTARKQYMEWDYAKTISIFTLVSLITRSTSVCIVRIKLILGNFNTEMLAISATQKSNHHRSLLGLKTTTLGMLLWISTVLGKLKLRTRNEGGWSTICLATISTQLKN